MGENREAEYLRSLLIRLEWEATEVDWDEPDAWSICPICHEAKTSGHAAGCKLDAAIRPTEG